jgi:hypothetical protein
MSRCACSLIPSAMSLANSWNIPGQAGTLHALQAMPRESGSSLLQTPKALECGYCTSSLIATASPQTQPPRNNQHMKRDLRQLTDAECTCGSTRLP